MYLAKLGKTGLGTAGHTPNPLKDGPVHKHNRVRKTAVDA